MATPYEEILALFREAAEARKETERKFQEVARLREQFQEADRRFRKTALQLKDID